MAEHPRRRSVVDPAAVVLEAHEHLVVAVGDEGERVVGLAVIGEREAGALRDRASAASCRGVLVLVDEDRVEERTAPRDIAPALDLHERGVLVLAQPDLLRPDLLQQVAEATLGVHAARAAAGC